MKHCAPQQPCKPIESKCILYSGSYLNQLDVYAGTSLDIILKKINDQIGSGSGSNSLNLIGDVLASGNLDSPITATLSSSGVIAGTYGSSSIIPVFTVDYKGRITNVSPVNLTYTEVDPVFSAQKGQPLGVATLDSSGLVPLSQLPPLGVGTVTSVGISSADLTVSNSPITTSGVITLTLPNIVSPNTFNNVQFNAKGQVIGGSNVSYLTVETDPVYTSEKGQPLGAATLTASGKLTASQFPTVQDTSSIDLTFNTITNTLSADVLGYNPTDWNTAYNRSPIGLSFNIANGDLTLNNQDGTTIVENLDFRYLLESEADNFIQNQNTNPQTANFWIAGNGEIDGNLEVTDTTTLNDLVVQGNATILSTITLGSPAKGTIAPNADSMDYVAGIGFDAQFGAGGRNNDITIANATGIVTFTQTPRVNGNTMWHNGNFPLSVSSPTNGQYLVYNGTSWVNTTTSFITSIAHNHFIANNAGTNQFSFGVNEAIRVAGAGDTTVSFNAGTKTITITSIPGSGGGGAVTSFNGRTGGVVSVEGDYNLTSLGDVTINTPLNNQLLQYNGTEWVNFTPTYISANQTITLSSDITGSGTTSIAATISNNAVTYAKMQDVTAARLLGRYSATNGDPQEIQLGTGISLNSSTGVLSATGTGGTVTSVALSLPSIFTVSGSPVIGSGTLTGTLNVQSANAIFAGPTTGAAAAPAFRALVNADIPVLDTSKITTGTFPIARGGTGLSTLGTANQLIRVNAGATALEYFTPTYLTGNQTITLSGDVAGSGTTSITTTIGNATVTYAKIQNVTSSRILGRFSAGSGPTQEIQLGAGLTLNTATGVLSASGTGGTVTSVGIASTDLSVSGSPITTSGNITLNVNNNAITYAKLQDITGARLLGRYAASTGDAQEITIGTGLSLNTTTGVLSNTGLTTTPNLQQVTTTGNTSNRLIQITAQNGIPASGSGLELFAATDGSQAYVQGRNRGAGDPYIPLNLVGGTTASNSLTVSNDLTFAGSTVWRASNHAAGSAFAPTLTGANVLASLTSNSAGHITGTTTRVLTIGDIGAAPSSGSGNYIQNQIASAQSGSGFFTAGRGLTINAFEVRRDGLNTIQDGFMLRNAAVSRGVNFQLNADANPGLATWVHNGTSWIKRSEHFANNGMLRIHGDGGEALSLYRAIGTALSATGGIRFDAVNNGAAITTYGQIWGIIETNIAGSENGTIAFNTRTAGSMSEKMRITSAGRVAINTTSPATDSMLTVNGFITADGVKSTSSLDLTASTDIYFNTGGSTRAYVTNQGLGISTVPSPARGSVLQVQGNVWSTDAYILGITNSPIAEFFISGSDSVGIRTMMSTGTMQFSVGTGGATTAITIPSTGNTVIEKQIQIKGGTPGAGKVLTSDGTGLATWQTPAVGDTPTLTQVLTAGNTATNSITLGAAGNTNSYSYFLKRNISSVNYTGSLGVGLDQTALTLLMSNDASAAANRLFYIPALGSAPLFSPDNGTTKYTMLHTGNHAAGSAFTPTLTGANVPATFTTNTSGHVTAFTTRILTPTDIGAAPASGSGNYIQNQIASAQSGSGFFTAGRGLTINAFEVRRDGLNTIQDGFMLRNAAVSRGVNFQLNADANPGLATWVHNGTSWIKRLEILSSGATTISGTLTANDTVVNGDLTVTSTPGVGSGRVILGSTTGGARITGYGHNGTTWVSGGINYDGTNHNFEGGDVFVLQDLEVSGTVTATGGGFNSARSLKEDIREFTNSALEIISKIPIKQFKYKNGNNNTIGFIADEVPKEVLVDGKEAMDVYSTIGVLIKSVQELNERLNGLGNISK